MRRSVITVLIAIMLSGCAAIFESPVIGKALDAASIIMLPVGVVGTIAGNPMATYGTVQTIRELAKGSGRTVSDTDTGEEMDIDSIGR